MRAGAPVECRTPARSPKHGAHRRCDGRECGRHPGKTYAAHLARPRDSSRARPGRVCLGALLVGARSWRGVATSGGFVSLDDVKTVRQCRKVAHRLKMEIKQFEFVGPGQLGELVARDGL